MTFQTTLNIKFPASQFIVGNSNNAETTFPTLETKIRLFRNDSCLEGFLLQTIHGIQEKEEKNCATQGFFFN